MNSSAYRMCDGEIALLPMSTIREADRAIALLPPLLPKYYVFMCRRTLSLIMYYCTACLSLRCGRYSAERYR